MAWHEAINNRTWKKARRLSGLAKFERTTGTNQVGNKKVAKWRIPGSATNVKWAMLVRATEVIYKDLLRKENE